MFVPALAFAAVRLDLVLLEPRPALSRNACNRSTAFAAGAAFFFGSERPSILALTSSVTASSYRSSNVLASKLPFFFSMISSAISSSSGSLLTSG